MDRAAVKARYATSRLDLIILVHSDWAVKTRRIVS